MKTHFATVLLFMLALGGAAIAAPPECPEPEVGIDDVCQGAASAESRERCLEKIGESCFWQGFNHTFGLADAPEDFERASSFYGRACKFNYSAGCFAYGEQMSLGHLKGKDRLDALPYYRKACRLGNGDGCEKVGEAYCNGEGLPRSEKRGARYYKMACDRQVAEGCFGLAELAEKGRGIKENKAAAKSYYGMSCMYGLKKGCEAYNRMADPGEAPMKPGVRK